MSSLLAASHRWRGNGASHRDVAYRIIKEKIVTLELPPASLINESELMQQLDLGRTPIREALQRLALESLVVIMPRRGTIVADFNLRDLQKIFELRVELEGMAARLAAERATPTQISDMETLFSRSEVMLSGGDYHQLIQLDKQLHRALAEAAHNEFLEATLERLYTHVLRLWYVSLHKVSRLSAAIEEHRDIIEAVKAGDGLRAEQVMQQHVRNFQDKFAAVL